MGYDPKKRHGWARGLIHFHTQFSDGWASVLRAGEIAAGSGCPVNMTLGGIPS